MVDNIFNKQSEDMIICEICNSKFNRWKNEYEGYVTIVKCPNCGSLVQI